jgi:hypothetical protein
MCVAWGGKEELYIYTCVCGWLLGRIGFRRALNQIKTLFFFVLGFIGSTDDTILSIHKQKRNNFKFFQKKTSYIFSFFYGLFVKQKNSIKRSIKSGKDDNSSHLLRQRRVTRQPTRLVSLIKKSLTKISLKIYYDYISKLHTGRWWLY